MDRRSFLNLFGRGAVIAPVVAGSVITSAQGKLVEAAKVEIFEASALDNMPGPRWLHRLDGFPHERLWLARWRQEEKQHRTLSHLLDREPTQDERQVAAALVQWFGTSCGLGFLYGTFRAEGHTLHSTMDRNDKAFSDLWHSHSKNWPEFIRLRMRGGPPEILGA